MSWKKLPGAFLLSVFIPFLSVSQPQIEPDSLISQGNRSLLIFPIIIKTPETNWGFGLVGTYFFKTKKTEQPIRTSDIETLLLYTLNNQKVFTFGGNIYFPKEKYILKLQNSYSLFPDKTWGTGNYAPDSNEEHYKVEQFYIHPTLLKKTFKSFFAGISYELQRVMSLEHSATGILEQQHIPGINGGIASGLGGVINWDTRNHAFVPDKGALVQLSVTAFAESFGSDFKFVNYTAEMRKFFGIRKNLVLAFHGLAMINDGNVPIRNLALLGGSNIMRGYYSGRYADKNMAAVQSELRFPLIWRFSGVAFYGMGEVSDKVEDFSINGLKYSWGGGIRFALNEAEKLNLRVDYGVGKKSSGLYVTVAEAF